MLNWTELTKINQVEEIVAVSQQQPCVIYKHSSRCSLSFVAKHRLESDWDEDLSGIATFFLDVITHRDVSKYVAEAFEIHHESPQLLLIRNGECVYDESHLDISVQDLKENFQAAF